MAKKEHWLLNQKHNLESLFFFLFLFFLPTQLGKHFWPPFSYLLGIRSDYLSPTIYISDSLLIIVFIFWIIREKNLFIAVLKNRHTHVVLLLFFCLWLFWPADKLLTVYSFAKLLEYVLLASYLSGNIFNKYSLRTIALVLSFSFLIESFLAISQFIHQSSLDGLWYWLGERHFNTLTIGIADMSLQGALILRPYATFPHPNVLAGYTLLLNTLFLFCAKYYSAEKQKLYFYALFLLSIFILFLSYSREAIVCWIFAMFFILMFDMKKYISPKKFLTIILIATLLILSTIVLQINSRFLTLSSNSETVVQREQLIISSFSVLSQSPLIGVGLNNFLPALQRLPHYQLNYFSLQPVHNIFVLLLTEIGIIGLLITAIFLFSITHHLYKIFKTKNKYSIYSLITLILYFEIFFTGLFDHYWVTLQQGQLLLSFVIGLSLSVTRTKKP